MKIKPTSDNAGGVLVQLRREETQIPAQSLATPPAFKLSKILVPVDFSDCSNKALQYAIAFARQFGAQLTLLHVVEPFASVPEMAQYDVESMRDSRGELELLRRIIDDSVASSAELRRGTAHTEITDAAAELGADLIVISTHGRTGVSRLVLGSTAEKVVRHAPCPVLVVREREHEFLSDACPCVVPK